MSFILTNLLKHIPKQLTNTQEFLLQNEIEDSLLYQGTNLLELWSEEMISERRVKCIINPRLTWQDRASLYRQANIICEILKRL